jgi:hypothetical protein
MKLQPNDSATELKRLVLARDTAGELYSAGR